MVKVVGYGTAVLYYANIGPLITKGPCVCGTLDVYNHYIDKALALFSCRHLFINLNWEIFID